MEAEDTIELKLEGDYEECIIKVTFPSYEQTVLFLALDCFVKKYPEKTIQYAVPIIMEFLASVIVESNFLSEQPTCEDIGELPLDMIRQILQKYATELEGRYFV